MEEEIQRLKKENEELNKMNEVKSDLISISAHQLRTSLSALKWILKMFIEKDLGKITFEQESFIKRALVSSDRMLLLVNNLLTLNHSEDNQINFNFQKIDILNIIEQTLFEFSGETRKKNIELIFLRPEIDIPEIQGDGEMLRVVIQNLIENSIKYSDQNDKIIISLRYNKEENVIEFSVHDSGIGIKEEDQKNIFNKFFRATNAAEKDIVGSGLGLFTTKSIVEKHKGKIWFESMPNSGTTFFVKLPIL
jgi:signal transduction histidine kinase